MIYDFVHTLRKLQECQTIAQQRGVACKIAHTKTLLLSLLLPLHHYYYYYYYYYRHYFSSLFIIIVVTFNEEQVEYLQHSVPTLEAGEKRHKPWRRVQQREYISRYLLQKGEVGDQGHKQCIA